MSLGLEFNFTFKYRKFTFVITKIEVTVCKENGVKNYIPGL